MEEEDAASAAPLHQGHGGGSVGGPASQTLISLFYGVGIGANALALALLSRHESARSRRQTLLLRCLVASDLLALTGSFVLMHLQMHARLQVRDDQDLQQNDVHAFCAARVAWRAFGLGSGAVAQVMAAERWMALNRPFFYQKHVTARCLARAVMVLWFLVALLAALPFLGLGLYFDPGAAPGHKCVRYRFATKPADVAYAYLVFAFGMSLCLSIVGCNVGVLVALWRLRKRRRSLPRRMSSSRGSTGSASVNNGSINLSAPATSASASPSAAAASSGASSQPLPWGHHATREEVAFARLMGIISVAFVACWIPQLATIVAAQVDPLRREQPLYRIADVAIALNFVLDPFLYVVLRARARRAIANAFSLICCRCGKDSSPDGECGVEAENVNIHHSLETVTSYLPFNQSDH